MQYKMILPAGLCLAMGWGGAAYAVDPNPELPNEDATSAVQSEPVTPGVFSGDVRDLPAAELASPDDFPPRVTRPPLDPDPSSKLIERPASPLDPLLQLQPLLPEIRTFNPPDLNFPGIPFQGGAPPDTVGEVGSNH